MRLFSVLLLVALPLSAYLATIGNVDMLLMQQEHELDLVELSQMLHVAQDARSLNLIWTMLPLYGWIKLSSFLDRKALEKVYAFFKKHPQHYESFRTELASEGVQIPAFEDVDLSVFTDEDFKLLLDIVGKTTIKQALTQDFIDYLEKYIDEHPELIDLLHLRLDQLGVVLSDEIDANALVDTVLGVLGDVIVDFMPTAISIIVGKRDLTIQLTVEQKEMIKNVLRMLQASNSIHANKVLQFLSQNGITVQQIINDIDANTYDKYLTPEAVSAVKAFLQSNPEILAIAVQLFPFLNDL